MLLEINYKCIKLTDQNQNSLLVKRQNDNTSPDESLSYVFFFFQINANSAVPC